MGLGEKWGVLAIDKQSKISEESAQEQIKALCEHYDVNINDILKEQEFAVDQALSKLLIAFKAGRLEIKDDDKGFSVIQYLKDGDTITYRELAGRDKARLGDIGDNPIKYVHRLLGFLCGLGEDAIGKLTGPDLKAAEGLGQYFLLCC
jgi:hypothetical protein